MLRVLSILLLSLSLSVSHLKARTCSDIATKNAAAALKTVRSHLLKSKIEDVGTDVPPAVQKQISEMKDLLTALVDARMRCVDENNLEYFERDLAAVLGISPKQNGISDSESDRYGAEFRVMVRPLSKMRSLLAVQLRFRIECGFDTLLLVYEHQSGGWLRALRWQSGQYQKISDAYGDFFEFTLISTQSTRRWALAAAHGHPWCTSRWSAFDIDVLQASTDPEHPEVIAHEKSDYVRDVEPVMKTKPDGFELRVNKGCLDQAIMTKRGIYRYRMSDGKIQRVQPIAMNGRDFVDEWLQLDWTEAQSWSASDDLASLQAAHLRLNQRDKKAASLLSYGPVHPCTSDAKILQVEVDQDPGGQMYFLIKQGENSFTVISASDKPNLECNGPNLMPTQ